MRVSESQFYIFEATICIAFDKVVFSELKRRDEENLEIWLNNI